MNAMGILVLIADTARTVEKVAAITEHMLHTILLMVACIIGIVAIAVIIWELLSVVVTHVAIAVEVGKYNLIL